MNRTSVPIHLQPHPPTHAGEVTPEPEPVWRRVKTIERVLRWFAILPPDQFDDAGVRMPRISNAQIRATLTDSRRQTDLASLLVLVIVAGFLSVGIATAFRTKATPLLLPLCLPLLMIIGVARTNNVQQARGLRIRTASLLEAGRCGTCGHVINGDAPDDRGLVRCAECASRWNPARYPHAASYTAHLDLLTARRPRHKESSRLVDDRLVMRIYPAQMRKAWKVEARLRPDLADRWSMLRTLERRALLTGFVRALRWGVPLLLAICAAMAFTLSENPAQLNSVESTLMLLCSLAGIVAFFMLVVAYSHVHTSRMMIRLEMCPTCRGLIDSDAPPEFDGCVRCATCGCLWKRDVVASAPAPNQPTETHPTSASPNAAP